MQIKIFTLVAMTCFVFFSCAKKISTTNAGNKNSTEVIKKNSPTPTNISEKPTVNEKFDMPTGIEKNVVAMLKRTPCFGKCPSYEVKILDNGTAVYNGFAYVEKIGKYEAKVSNDFMNRLQQESSKCAFTSFSSKYPIDGGSLTDIPSTISFVRSGKKSNQVVNNYDAPKELINFENWLDNEIQNLQWQKKDN